MNVYNAIEDEKNHLNAMDILNEVTKKYDIFSFEKIDPDFYYYIYSYAYANIFNAERILPIIKKRIELGMLYPNLTEMSDKLKTKKFEGIKKIDEKILSLDLFSSRIHKEIMEKYISHDNNKVIYNFNEITCLIEEAYGFRTRGMYSSLETSELILILEEMGFSQKEITKDMYNKGTKVNDLKVYFWQQHANSYVRVLPHVDHWHHLTDYDFSDITKGGVNYMNRNLENESLIFKIIRDIYFLECNQYTNEQISFLIDW